MKKARNFIGAVVIALAFTLGPAPAESAPVESVVAAPALVMCFSTLSMSLVIEVSPLAAFFLVATKRWLCF